jgi:PRC-barrel domain
MRGTGETFGTGTGMTEAYGWEGREVIDRDGERVGTIEALYTAEEVQRPEWAAVKTGLFGAKLSFVPIAGAQPSGEHVSVQFAKDHIKDAPRVEPDDESAARPCPARATAPG